MNNILLRIGVLLILCGASYIAVDQYALHHSVIMICAAFVWGIFASAIALATFIAAFFAIRFVITGRHP